MKTSRVLTAAALLTTSILLGGCMQGFTWFMAQFAPPEKVKAVTELPRDKTILVYVDSKYPLSYEPIKGMLTDQLNGQLLANKIAAAIVPRDRLLDLMGGLRDQELSKQEIGSKLGADLVLNVEIEEFSVRENDETPLWAGKMRVSLRVVDVPGVKRLWPLDQTEYPVPLVELREVENSSSTYGNIVAKALAIKTADKIAKIFYEHTVPNSGMKDKD